MKDDFIHVWVPGIREGAGGIQAFSRVYIQSICEAYPLTRIRVFVKNDMPAEDDPLLHLGVRFCSVANHFSWIRILMFVLLGWGYGLRERPICVVTTHLHFLPALSWLKWLIGVPVMSVLHGIEAWNLHGGQRVKALREADHLLAVSHYTRKAVIDAYGIEPAKISVVPNTFDAGRFMPGPKPAYLLLRYGLEPAQPVILTVSRLAMSERYKGHRQILAAIGQVRKKFPKVRYLVVGTGDDLSGLQSHAVELGVQDAVIFAGHVPVSELPDHYCLCDVFAMPSSREGFGIVFLEAMASGKPVIAGNSDGAVDALAEGRLGVLVDPNSIEQIADAVIQVLDQRPKGALWFNPEALRAEVVAQFGYERVSRLLADDLTRMIGRAV